MPTHRNARRSSHLVNLPIVSFLAVAASGLLLAACSTMDQGSATPPRQFDTGNMAYPAPLSQGEIGTTRAR